MPFNPAARVHDLVKHTYANETMIVFAVIGGGIGAYFSGGLAAGVGTGIGKEIGKFIGESPALANVLGTWKAGIPEIKKGSHDVYTNKREAARLKDEVSCHDKEIIQGSKMVSINKRPATRIDDLTECGAIATGSSDVKMGGPAVTEGKYESTTSGLLEFAIGVAGGLAKNLTEMALAPALVGAAVDEVKSTLRDKAVDALRDNGETGAANALDTYNNAKKWGERLNDFNKIFKY